MATAGAEAAAATGGVGGEGKRQEGEESAGAGDGLGSSTERLSFIHLDVKLLKCPRRGTELTGGGIAI